MSAIKCRICCPQLKANDLFTGAFVSIFYEIQLNLVELKKIWDSFKLQIKHGNLKVGILFRKNFEICLTSRI